MTLFYPVTNERFLTLADFLQTEIDKLSDDFTIDYTDTSDKAVSMYVWTYLHLQQPTCVTNPWLYRIALCVVISIAVL